MRKERQVCTSARVSLTIAGLVLAACSSDPPPSEGSIVPMAAEPVAPPALAGGQAMKAFINPFTGELRSPAEVEWSSVDHGQDRPRTGRESRARNVDSDGGSKLLPASSRGVGKP